MVTTSKFQSRRQINPLAQFHPQYGQQRLTYLPGPLDLKNRNLAVLGWDTEPIIETDIVRIVNQERINVGSPPLSLSPKLTQAANLRVETIIKHQNFSHTDEFEHIQLDTVLPRVKYLFDYASENIGLAQDTAPGIVQGFMSSPPHRQNLLDNNLKETGVGIKKGWFKGNFVVMVVQIFGSPVSPEVALGYSPGDVTTVAGLIAGIDNELVKTENFLSSDPGSTYYLGWEKLLRAQKTRLSQIYTRMLSGLPYESKDYDLIAAYNSAWATAPK